MVVDDEPLARRKIRKLLSADADIEMVGECANGRDAIAAIETQRPAIVFLDVQMPEISGFEVLESLAGEALPLIIFVTAHDQYALRALEVHAFDYLLKPFDKTRFDKTLQQAKARLRAEDHSAVNTRTLALLEEWRASTHYLERLMIKSGGRVFFIKAEEIDWIEAEGKYVRLHVGKQTHLLREAISNLESRLDPKIFLRIHRSHIVNLERIQELEAWFHNQYRVILRDGTTLMMSRSCRKHLGEFFGSEW
ncbi:MAG: LytTR family transcriptional regulator DNA-binding domain-containing protein [Acidobacteria bacterium]|nr:LytTR family transcriptional regulator DNA-binding domain-containing protein [Acidobacteriota bacterium]